MAKPKHADAIFFSAQLRIDPRDAALTCLSNAESFLYKGDTANAGIFALQAQGEILPQTQTSILTGIEFLLGRIALLHGDADAFTVAIANLAALCEKHPQKSNKIETDMAYSFLMSLLGRPAEMASWLNDSGSPPFHDRLFTPAMPFATLCRARYLLLADKPEILLDESGNTIRMAEATNCGLAVIYAYIHDAAARVMRGEHNNAENSLHKALKLALPEGLILPFAENYRWLGVIPGEAFGYVPREFAEAALYLAERLEAGCRAVCDRIFPTCGYYGLSPREYEAAALVVKGFSYSEIAGELNISLNTVKTHLKSAYRKTGASSRKVLREKLSQKSPFSGDILNN